MQMNRKVTVGIALGAALLVILGGMILDNSDRWAEDTDGGMGQIPFRPSAGVPIEDTLNYAVFETYGPMMIVVTLMLFGAIIGAASISKEENDDSD